MENKSHALLAGLFTIVLLIAAIGIAMWLNRDRTDWAPYEIATTQSIPGLLPQADVRYRGLDVGRVESIGFDPQQPGRILVRIRVQPDTPVTASTYATLGYQGVTGIAYVQLDDDGSRPQRLSTSAQDPGRIAMRPGLLDQLQQRGLAIMEQTEEVARRLNTILSDENRDTMLAAFDNVSKAAKEIEALPRQLQPTLARLPALTRQAQQTLSTLDTVGAEAQKLTGNLNGFVTELRAPDGVLDTVAASAERIGSAAGRLENETLPLANDVRTSLRALNRTLNSLSEQPQSVLFGAPDLNPGPGESGYKAPGR